MRIPLNNPPPISNGFGVPDTNAKFGRHAGIDWPVGTGTPVYAAVSGVVSIVQNDQYHGNVVDIRKGDKWYRVMHLRNFARTEGTVQEGDLIAYSNNTGLSTGPHVHFDVRTEYTPTSFAAFIDPLSLIKEEIVEPTADRGFIINRYKQILGRSCSEAEIAIYMGLTHDVVYDALLDSDEFKNRLNSDFAPVTEQLFKKK